MSDAGAAAAAMGAPEAIVLRSAEARAKAAGASVDDILSAWAGGTATPSASPTTDTESAPAAAESSSADASPTTEAEPSPAPAPAPVATIAATEPPAAEVVVAGPDPDAAPLLVGRHDRSMAMLATIFAILLVGGLSAALAPSQAARVEVNASVGGQPVYSAVALEGRSRYLAEGCTSCHTMLVRSTATDADLGRVTRVQDVAPLAPDTIGSRRIGPDLANIGTRTDDVSALVAFLRSPGDAAHPPYAYLGEEELAVLAQFLAETGR